MTIKAVYTHNNGYDTITIYNASTKELLARHVLNHEDEGLIEDFKTCQDFENWDYGSQAAEMAIDINGNTILLDEIKDEIVDDASFLQERIDFILKNSISL